MFEALFKTKFNVVVVEDNPFDGEAIRSIFATQTRMECETHLVIVKGDDKLEDVVSRIRKAIGKKGVVLLDNHYRRVEFSGANIAPHFEGKVVSISGEPVRYARGWHYKRFLDSQIARNELVEFVDLSTRNLQFPKK